MNNEINLPKLGDNNHQFKPSETYVQIQIVLGQDFETFDQEQKQQFLEKLSYILGTKDIQNPAFTGE